MKGASFKDNSGQRGGPEWRQQLKDKEFAIPERRAWPIHDLRHAKIAITFMLRGFGDQRDYKRVVEAILKRYKDDKDVIEGVKKVIRKYKLGVRIKDVK